MHLRIACFASGIMHLGLLAGVWLWPARPNDRTPAYTVIQGEPLAAAFTSAPSSAQVTVEIAPPIEVVETPLPPPLPPPTYETFLPAESSKAPASLLEITRQETEPTIVTTAAPLATVESPPSRQPQVDKVEPPSEREPTPLAKAPPTLARQVRPVALVAQQAAIAMPLQVAAAAGAQVDQLPRKLPANPAPAYPPDALRSGIEGRLTLRVKVGADGTVDEAQIATSSGSSSLDQSALRTVLRWRFEPAQRGGEAVAYEVLVPIKFTIQRG
ncbi:energy transducer TonB [Lignipirellula cremea]|uniref:Transport protein TonB n=1 Tax=Lignipirellula cremea TaxID=2528010 RepID=A0A518E4N8_9BACT|nr:energy transducer TonB [Lignipirellula cremea]QDU99061.1 transport protein TonB [Lignipirellula cremea]